jgi:potassium-transporting ATPase potassium-binding subunit
MSYLTQMLGLTHQNFLSAATGIVLAVALIRGFSRALKTVGNFWVDITRCTLYILMPICIVYTLSWSGRECRRRSDPMSRLLRRR